MTEDTKFHRVHVDLAPWSGQRCTVRYRDGRIISGRLVVNGYPSESEINRSWPWRFHPGSYPWRFLPGEPGEDSESYTSQGTVMKLSPRPNDIVSIYENPEPEPEPEPEEPGGLEERVVQLESKIETLLRRFHELSSGL